MLTDPEYATQIKQAFAIIKTSIETSCAAQEEQMNIETKPYYSQSDFAKDVGVTEATISRAIKVAELVEENPEMASLIKQFDDMMRKKFGSSEKGGFGGGAVVKDMEGRLLESNNRDGWTTTKTAEQLGISQSIMLHMQ